MDKRLQEELKSTVIAAGGSKTIYAFVMPETRAAFNHVMDNNRQALHDVYDEAWTSKQDAMHREFFATWRSWSASVIDLEPFAFPHTYPTAGASEGLREAIGAYGNKARSEGFEPRIHIFDGEYEGYGAYAKASKIPLIAHKRSDWRTMIETLRPTDQIYLSHPSALDGNLWPEYDSFMQTLHEQKPETDLVLDLTYVGAVAKPYAINATYPNITQIAFSLSKPMGVYYHRIGGMLSRTEMPGLWGNAWFKNLLSLDLGTALMKSHTVYDLPRRYSAAQTQAAEIVGKNLDLDLSLSDVWLLATAQNKTCNQIERFLLRGTSEDACVRVCLTPMIDRLVGRGVTPTPELDRQP